MSKVVYDLLLVFSFPLSWESAVASFMLLS